MNFNQNKPILSKQYTDTHWIPDSGLEVAELERAVLTLEEELQGHTKAYIKARTLHCFAKRGRSLCWQRIFSRKS